MKILSKRWKNKTIISVSALTVLAGAGTAVAYNVIPREQKPTATEVRQVAQTPEPNFTQEPAQEPEVVELVPTEPTPNPPVPPEPKQTSKPFDINDMTIEEIAEGSFYAAKSWNTDVLCKNQFKYVNGFYSTKRSKSEWRKYIIKRIEDTDEAINNKNSDKSALIGAYRFSWDQDSLNVCIYWNTMKNLERYQKDGKNVRT